MKKITVTVNYTVPNWHFCNSDNLINGGELTKNVCKFCIKTRGSHYCALYGASLSVNDGLISKIDQCKRATAGYNSIITSDHVDPPAPTIPPKELMKQTVDLYSKTLSDLLNQGYPRPMAEKAARKYVIGD